ncbi:WAT1-related protein At1g70260 [Linum grandiflorum]
MRDQTVAYKYSNSNKKVIRSLIESAVPFVGMIAMEGCTIALTILTKTVLSSTSTSGGTAKPNYRAFWTMLTATTPTIRPFVFVVYTNVLGTLFLFPFSFLYHRSSSPGNNDDEKQDPRRWPGLALLLRYFFLGFTGITLAQNLAFMGLAYSSPIVVCAMGLLTPAFSFILEILLTSFKTVDWSQSTFRFKLMGTLVSAIGAVTVQLYKGPYIREASATHLQAKQHRFVFYSLADDSWTVGCLLLAASSLCVSVWNSIQMNTVKRNPEVMKVASYYSFAGTVQCAIFAAVVERDLNAWKLNVYSMEFLVIFLAAIFGSVIRSSAHMWSARAKGGLYVAMFQPFRIVWATFFGLTFFVNGLHYGSVIGTVVCGMGYYTIIWGKIKEDEGRRNGHSRSNTSIAHYSNDNYKAPLLIKDDSQV